MSLDHILLGLLRDPATGYDLKNAFSERIRHFWSAELSQIYPTLKRLEQRRMLRSRVEPSPRGPNRKVYSLTGEGREEVRRWLRSGPEVGTERFAYLAQLYFMDAVGDLRETRAFMEELRAHLAGWLGQLRSVEGEVTAAHGDEPERYSDAGFHRFATLRMGIHSIGSKVAWCDETLAAIDRRLAAHPGAEPVAGGPRGREAVAGGRATAGGQEAAAGGRAAAAGGQEAMAGEQEAVAGGQEAMPGERGAVADAREDRS